MKLTIEKIVYGGQGLARVPPDAGPQGGMRVFVPFTLPDERVDAEIVGQHRGYCVGEVRQIEQASPFRAAPPCPWFGTCGGCQLQHSTYPYQVEMKRAMLAESLIRAGVRELPTITTLTGTPLGYRNRVRLQLQRHPEFAIGYRQAKSHRLTPIDHCPVAAPLLNRCLAAIQAMAGVVPADGTTEIELFTNHDESELLVTLWVTRRLWERKSTVEFLVRLQARLPQLLGAAVLVNDPPAGEAKPLLTWGQPSLRYRVAGCDYTVGLGSFFQINTSLLDSFVPAVVGTQHGALSWDLYAGGGLFSLALATRYQHVLAVEFSPSSHRDLRKNLQDTSATLVHSTTLEFLKKATRREGGAPDLVVLDPPRAGAGVEVCRLLAACGANRIIYVSCDPATLGRDLTALIQSGYRLQRLQLVDMFPQTSHLETIATLER